MYQNKKISLIIPCYNEEKGLKEILPTVPKFIDEIIIIDNNSSDNTAKIAKEFGSKVVFEKIKGYGRAYKKGFNFITGDIIITIDGDAQHPTDKIQKLIKILFEKNLDFVSASRFPLANQNLMSKDRIIANKILTSIMNFLFHTNIKDSQSGMWVFKKNILPKLNLTSNEMSFSEEIKLKVILNPEINFSEYHINHKKRIGKLKLFPIKDGLENLLFLFKYYFRQIK